jgi:hypothetical protein
MTIQNPVTLILRLDLPDPKFLSHLELHLESMLTANQLDGYYFLTKNGAPVHHRDEHLELENRLGRAISAIQNDDILIRSLADTDPNTGIEYGELT